MTKPHPGVQNARATLLGGLVVLGSLASAPAAAEFRWPWQSAQPRDAAAAPADAVAAPPSGPAQVTRVLPPRRPANWPKTPDATEVTGTVVAGAALPITPAAATAAASAGLSDRQVVDKANAYFNGIATLVGDFVQVGADGRRVGGKLYLSRPGKLRFEYEAPSTLEVIADGRSVAVRDRKLATQDLYLIGQTPLKFLLRDNIDLARDVKVVDVAQDAEGVRVMIEDRATLGGTSKITLHFDREVEALTRWRVLDPQGYQTTVGLSNVERGRRVDPRLFVINYERMVGESSNR